MPHSADHEDQDVFPEPAEATAAAHAKLAADLSRLPVGTRLRLLLSNGEVRAGEKGDYGARGIRIDGADFIPFDQVERFETVRFDGA